MRYMVNGSEVEMMSEDGGSVDSDKLRSLAGIPADRPLILQSTDGSNMIVNPGAIIHVKPDQFFIDAPLHIRGTRLGTKVEPRPNARPLPSRARQSVTSKEHEEKK